MRRDELKPILDDEELEEITANGLDTELQADRTYRSEAQ
jgi:hypothetical protein